MWKRRATGICLALAVRSNSNLLMVEEGEAEGEMPIWYVGFSFVSACSLGMERMPRCSWGEAMKPLRGARASERSEASHAITCNHMPTATIRGSHTQSHAITCHQRNSSHLSMRIGSILYCSGTGLLYCVSTAGTHSAGPKGG